MVLYSFYDPPIKERFRDHISLALSNVNPGSRLVEYSKKLNADFDKILRLSIIFHDFGKVVFNQFEFKEGRKLTFPGHEVISCWAVYHLNENFTKEIVDRKIIALSVLMHHHPMGIKDRISFLKKSNMEVNDETFELFFKELEGIYNGNVKIGSVKVSQIAWETERIYRELWKDVWMNSSVETRKVFLLNIQGLVASDYTSANKLRGGDKGFINVIRKFDEMFMSSVDNFS